MILEEYDASPNAVINPEMLVDKIEGFPDVTVSCVSQQLFKTVLDEFGYPYVEGTTWTKDAPYRETRQKVNRRKEQDALCVEMECAGMQALCDFRGTEFFQFFYAGDNLDHSDWQPRSLSGDVRLDDKSKIALLAFELGLRIKKEVQTAGKAEGGCLE